MELKIVDEPREQKSEKDVVEEAPRRRNYWTEAEAKGDIELPRCIHGEPRNVFCGVCEA